MAKDKNKNQAYGTFAAGKKGFLVQIRKRTALIILAVVFVGGSAGAVYKAVDSLRTKKQAAVAVVPTTLAIPAWWQQQYFGTSVCAKEICQPSSDPDKDKLTNQQEFYYHTHPLNAFTIEDKFNDGELVAMGYDPSREGRVTFEVAESSDSVLGESLVFGQDLKTMISETADVSKVNLPVVKKQEIKIVPNSVERVNDYLVKSNEAIVKYFPNNAQQYVEQAIISRNPQMIADVQQRLYSAEIELRQLAVPEGLAQMHQYSIMFVQTLSKVVDVPSASDLENEANVRGNLWYESTQALALLYQKINAETQRLQAQNK